jgi:predicted membrane-bound spermidine synthase
MKIRIPAWIRLGIAGLGLGALLLGLVWPYVFGPLGAQPGAFVSMAGALMLIGAGVASLVLDRHAGDRPVV